MHAAATLEDYLSEPIGKYLCGPTYIVWWLSARLNGILLWGRPEEQHIRKIAGALEAELAPGVAPHVSLIDARHLETVGLGAFNTMSEYLRARRELRSRVVARKAMLRPGGLPGAAIAGFYAVLAADFPVNVFTEPALAMEWLGVGEDAGVVEELEDIRVKAIGDSLLVTTLRIHLERNLGETLKDAATAFGISPRDLQRKLQDAHTRFKIEQNEARIRVAKMLLTDTEYDLKRIAIEIGCASAQHFSALFRELVGESPSQWRARQGADPRGDRGSQH